MKYEYNGNLLEEDRINLVSKEIMERYPNINISLARQVAMLEGKISTEKTTEMEFNRLYNILLLSNHNPISMKLVYADLISLIENNKQDPKINYYHAVLLEIYNYLQGQRDFPLLEEFEQ